MKAVNSITSDPGKPVRIPGDKSISHRALILAALAEGDSHLHHLSHSEDCMSTIRCLRQLGIEIEPEGSASSKGYADVESWIVHGNGLHGLSAPAVPLDCGNSATTMRLLAGILAGTGFSSTLTGDDSLVHRPMGRILEPLERMGANAQGKGYNNDPASMRELYAPLIFEPASLHGIPYTMPVASAQVKSCLLLAGLYADGPTTIVETMPTRDHTERLLAAFGADLHVEQPSDGASLLVYTNGKDMTGETSDAILATSMTLRPGHDLLASDIDIPGDLSSAAYFLVAATILPGSSLCLSHIGINPTRDGLLQVLQEMGAEISVENVRLGIEPSADLIAQSAPLHGITIHADRIPTLIDEIPILAVAAACAEGTTEIRGLAELRHKETDRLHAVAEGLRAMGATLEERDDDLIIQGKGISFHSPDALSSAPLKAASIKTYGDHRIAMAFSIAALVAEGNTTLSDSTCVSVSYPGFYTDLRSLLKKRGNPEGLPLL